MKRLESTSECVALVHGLMGTRLDMWPIARSLRAAGFETRLIRYRSLFNNVRSIAGRVADALTEIDRDPRIRRWHLITHSLGGIVARHIFVSHDFQRLHRLVMLAPPNQGSHAATFLAPYLRWLAPTLDELSDLPDSLVNRLAPRLELPNLQFGIVTAGKDRVIRRGHTRLEGSKETVEVDGHHGILTWYPETAYHVTQFVQFGSFSQVPDTGSEAASGDNRKHANGEPCKSC